MSYYRIPNPDLVSQTVVLKQRTKKCVPARVLGATSHASDDGTMSELLFLIILDQGVVSSDPFKGGRPTSQMFSFSHVARVFLNDHESMDNLRALARDLTGGKTKGLSALKGHVIGIVPDDSDLYVEAICPERKKHNE